MRLLSLLLGSLAAYQQPVVFSSRRAAAASIACVASPPIKTSAAASSIIERLSLLPATRSRPVNTEGLGRIVRSADTLRGSVLLQVLLHLKEERKWELAIALAALVEASFQEVNPLALAEASVKERTIDDVDEDDDEAMDAEFRRMVASSPNYVGSVDPIIDGEGDAPHPMAALLRKGPSVEAAAAAATRMMTPLKGSAPNAPPVETTHYNVLIATCAAARRWQEALDLLQRMQQRGVPRDTVTYNSVLSALGRGGRWRLALATFKQMRAERVPPNTVTFASAIAACAQAGEWERALKLLDTCFATGTPRNTIVYSSAISACEKAGEWRPALDLIARMEDRDEHDLDGP
ncbi:mitochondrial protein [Chrysochromulina tobinii]|uniref:Mitochondrial protein n=1 Tax=Chrysochromulina tobinii TaxID=1460289 RepID=A0A0M0K7L2_9EUKA|nr:mitochondrial protein [Chrysochromulina tobinii]|eukprot:KOO34810.1 mitochondrial protein [Chrysochromulina sp. CCMP291]